MAIRNDAGLMLESVFSPYFWRMESGGPFFSGWRRRGGMEKLGVFSIGADFE